VVWVVLGFLAAGAGVSLLILVSFGSHRGEYGYTRAERRKYFIVQLVPEQRSQPTMGSRNDLRRYLNTMGVDCRDYSEWPDSWLFGIGYGECSGVSQRYTLVVFPDSSAKFDDIDGTAGMCDVISTGRQYWVEGPNWTVHVWGDDQTESSAHASAVATAHALGARLERSCKNGKPALVI
jgi:hypothetical protein